MNTLAKISQVKNILDQFVTTHIEKGEKWNKEQIKKACYSLRRQIDEVHSKCGKDALDAVKLILNKTIWKYEDTPTLDNLTEEQWEEDGAIMLVTLGQHYIDLLYLAEVVTNIHSHANAYATSLATGQEYVPTPLDRYMLTQPQKVMFQKPQPVTEPVVYANLHSLLYEADMIGKKDMQVRLQVDGISVLPNSLRISVTDLSTFGQESFLVPKSNDCVYQLKEGQTYICVFNVSENKDKQYKINAIWLQAVKNDDCN